MNEPLFKRRQPGETNVERLAREWAARSSAPFKRDTAEVQFWGLVDDLERERPDLTGLESFSWARNTPRGKALWEQMSDKGAILAAVTRGEVDKRDRVEIRKEENRMHSTVTIKDAAWSAIEDAGAALQQREPSLGKAEAIAKFVKTPEARELVACYRGPDANLTRAEYIEKHRTLAVPRAAGFERWDQAIDQRAKLIQQRDGTDYPSALSKVAIESPAMWDCYLAEQRGA